MAIQLLKSEVFKQGTTITKLHHHQDNSRLIQVQGFREVIRSGGLESVPVYNGVVHCITTVYKQEGILGFYKGAVPSLLKVSFVYFMCCLI